MFSVECYFNLKEKEIRAIEQIEEDYLRQLLNTERGSPISQLYLEGGEYPARFDIMKIQVLFFHYILNQDEKSLIYKFLKAQIKSPMKGDWIQNVRKNY